MASAIKTSSLSYEQGSWHWWIKRRSSSKQGFKITRWLASTILLQVLGCHEPCRHIVLKSVLCFCFHAHWNRRLVLVLIFSPNVLSLRNREYIWVLCLKFHFLIHLLDFLFWNDCVSHKSILISKVEIILTQLHIVIPKKSLDIICSHLLSRRVIILNGIVMSFVSRCTRVYWFTETLGLRAPLL